MIVVKDVPVNRHPFESSLKVEVFVLGWYHVGYMLFHEKKSHTLSAV